jgi:hypothetical protein
MFTIKYKGVHIQIQTQILMEKYIIKKLQWCLSMKNKILNSKCDMF